MTAVPSLIVSILLTFGLIIVGEYLVGWAKVLSAWTLVPWMHLLLPGCLVLLSYALRGVRIYDWYGPLDVLSVARVVALHNFWNNLMPMRAGEVSFPLLLKQHFDVSLVQGTAGLVWFRVLDLSCLLLLFAVSMSIVIDIRLLVPTIILAVITVLAAPRVMGKIKQGMLVSRFPRLEQLARSFTSSPAKVWRCLVWTFMNWSVKLTAFAWILSVFAQISFFEGMVGAIGGEITSVLPVHGFAGAGTYEAGVFGFLQISDLHTEAALAAGINLHLFLLSITFMTGIAAQLVPAPKSRNS